ncbi:OV-16 antigen [Trichonephila inaurata madagascariensis]|uniref:OV-16 antigen n=1 Tax=Trichonephila inaurata madagascariensis TaxID=2747483 RepID=A0A8X6MIJ6_9ARAC|nr:OV-16 antigen [Trichonephila inaurata madagascariensis]
MTNKNLQQSPLAFAPIRCAGPSRVQIVCVEEETKHGLADASNPENPHLANYRNWVVEDIPGNIYNGHSASAYKQPNPPLNSDAHRYIFLVYQQPTSKKLQETFDDDLRVNLKVKTFVNKRNLIGPLAGNFMYVRHL